MLEYCCKITQLLRLLPPVMKLWTFQSAELENLLDKYEVIHADWRLTPVNWRPAYQWMATEMERHGIALNGHAPVWAWHSCGKWYGQPTVGTARSLLTDYQLLNGIVNIELEVPDELCLLSSYGRFNELLDEVIDYGAIRHPECHYEMFSLPLEMEPNDDVQAAIPCIRKEWIREIRPVDIKPGKDDYDWEMLV